MNERIQELAGQAKFMAEEDINRQISYNAELKAFAEKFAELIVRECAAIAGKAEYSDTWLEPVEDAIKQHFGVE